jgi:diguanylate cyclase (GGDEF)-like protein
MPDEQRTDEPGDDQVVDLTKVKHERARKGRDSDRATGADQTEVQRALDRNQKQIDRDQDELDRDQAAALERSSSQREAAGDLARAQTSLDRSQSALDREQARLDRAQAALNREHTDRQDYLIDDLTGMLRRGPGLRELQQEIERAGRQGHRLVLAFIDVDGLKAVNDERGHAAGDQLLREVSDALREGLRSYDLILRYGGDEFVCALSDADTAHAERRLGEVAEVLAAAPSHGSIAWGLAELRAADTLDDLVARADSALYGARRGRRDTTPRT